MDFGWILDFGWCNLQKSNSQIEGLQVIICRKETLGLHGGLQKWLQRVMDAMVSLSSFLADPSLRWAYEVDYLETQVQGAFSLPLRSIWSLWVLTRNHFHPLFSYFCNVHPIFCVVLLCLRKRSMFHVLLSGIPRLVWPKA